MKTPLLLFLLACGVFLGTTPARAVSFTHADRNRDGVVSFEEAERAFPRLNEVLIAKADKNGNGVIDKGEMPFLNSMKRFQDNR